MLRRSAYLFAQAFPRSTREYYHEDYSREVLRGLVPDLCSCALVFVKNVGQASRIDLRMYIEDLWQQ